MPSLPHKIILAGAILVAGAAAAATAAEQPKPGPAAGPLPQASLTGKLRETARPAEPVTFLGVSVAPVERALGAQLRLPAGQGLVVVVVEPDSPAAQAGLQPDDVLTRFEDQILIEPRQLAVLVRSRNEGEKIGLTYFRAGAEAKATATLTRRVPPPEARTFRWFNNDGGLLENGLGPAPMNAPVPDVFRRRLDVMENGARTGGAGVIVNPPGLPVAPGEPPRVMVFRPQATVMVADDSGTLQVRTDRGEQMLTVRNPDGEVVFSGPITSPADREALPEGVRQRLQKLEKLDVMEPGAGLPVLPEAGDPGAPPATVPDGRPRAAM